MAESTSKKNIETKELKESIKDILKDADLDSLSAKKVRKMLESKFDTDLSERKAEIDKLVMEAISAKEDESQQEDESQEEDDSQEERSNGVKKEPEISTDDERDGLEPVQKKSKVSKKNGDVKVDDDEELAKQLHEEELDHRTRGGRKRRKPVKPKVKSDSPKKKRAGTSMYSKKCQLSEDLAAIVGEDKMARSEVVKKLWEIIKERNLKDPKNGQYMLCDDQLKKVFGKKRVRMFGMMKDLKYHIVDIKDDKKEILL